MFFSDLNSYNIIKKILVGTVKLQVSTDKSDMPSISIPRSQLHRPRNRSMSLGLWQMHISSSCYRLLEVKGKIDCWEDVAPNCSFDCCQKLASYQVVAKPKMLTQKQETKNSFLQSKTHGSPLQPTHFKRCSFSVQGKCSAFPVSIFADKLVSPMLTVGDQCSLLVTKAILPYAAWIKDDDIT